MQKAAAKWFGHLEHGAPRIRSVNDPWFFGEVYERALMQELKLRILVEDTVVIEPKCSDRLGKGCLPSV